ncbi:MAG: NUDIX domain-containing protein [Zoogloeaceae bacterium]|jgi:NADH pyrophosphatase NudC (nudix superfamily)|nr:NUDIX domain-containing protein [Zoogloeaceae bacterium]
MKFCPRCAAPLDGRDIAGRMRRVCPNAACGYVFWDNPLPVLAGLVERDGLIVLARNSAWPEKMFGLITGFMERDETPEEGIAREVKEELGLDTLSASLIGVYPFQRRNEVILAYHVTAHGEIALNEELSEFRLIPPQKLRPWDAGTGMAVRDWLSRRNAHSTAKHAAAY